MSVEIPLGGEKVSVDMLRTPKTSDDVMVKLDAHQIEYIVAFIREHGLADVHKKRIYNRKGQATRGALDVKGVGEEEEEEEEEGKEKEEEAGNCAQHNQDIYGNVDKDGNASLGRGPVCLPFAYLFVQQTYVNLILRSQPLIRGRRCKRCAAVIGALQ